MPPADRLSSLDAFRGFVIATMVFVNHLTDTVPNWMRHMNDVYGEKVDAYSFVDLVFPGFLFMVGFAIPLSFYSKMNQGVSPLKLLWRLAARTAVLVFIGVIMVNLEDDTGVFNAQAVGIGKSMWATLAYLSIILLCLTQPQNASPLRVRIQKILKIGAAVLLAIMLVLFRAGEAGHLTWLQPSWWGILGLIGWAYLGSGLLYLLSRGKPTALMGMLGFMACMEIGNRHGLMDWLGPLQSYNSDIFGTHAVVATAGVLVGCLFVGKEKLSWKKVVPYLLVLGAGLYLAGMLLRPLYGINKNDATISWGLVSAGWACWVFLVFYLILEVAGWRKWAQWSLIPVGQNALLAYMFSEGIDYFFDALFHGSPFYFWGFNSLACTLLNGLNIVIVVCASAAICTRLKISMRL